MSYAGRQDGGGFLVKSKIKEQKLKFWYSAERDIFLLKKRPLGRYVDFNFITLNLYISLFSIKPIHSRRDVLGQRELNGRSRFADCLAQLHGTS